MNTVFAVAFLPGQTEEMKKKLESLDEQNLRGFTLDTDDYTVYQFEGKDFRDLQKVRLLLLLCSSCCDMLVSFCFAVFLCVPFFLPFLLVNENITFESDSIVFLILDLFFFFFPYCHSGSFSEVD